MDNNSELEIGGQSFDSSQVCYIHLHANTLGKDMNPPTLPPAMC